MRKLIVSCYVSLDGVIENPMWTVPYWSDEISEFQHADLFASDALLLGRETYEGFMEAWPSRAGADAFADRINAMTKYVVSRTLQSAEWNATVLEGDLAQTVTELKQQDGMNILKYGGGPLMGTLADLGLIDEYHILVYPITVGSGAKLFPDGCEVRLKLVESRAFESGVVLLRYVPDTAPVE